LNRSDRRLLTVSEVAEATGLSPNAVYRAIWDGELRASKLRGRVRVQLADLDAWIDSNLVTTRGAHEESPHQPAHRAETGRAGDCSSCSKPSSRSHDERADSGHALSHSGRR
jgi:excisionase family DNA binding protein